MTSNRTQLESDGVKDGVDKTSSTKDKAVSEQTSTVL